MSKQREAGKAGARVCVCGYDLTGLPERAKCPECGKAWTQAGYDRPSQVPLFVLLVSPVVPTVLVMIANLVGVVGAPLQVLEWIDLVGMGGAVIWLVAGVPIMGVLLARRVLPFAHPLMHVLLVVALFVVAWFGNFWLSERAVLLIAQWFM